MNDIPINYDELVKRIQTQKAMIEAMRSNIHETMNADPQAKSLGSVNCDNEKLNLYRNASANLLDEDHKIGTGIIVVLKLLGKKIVSGRLHGILNAINDNLTNGGWSFSRLKRIYQNSLRVEYDESLVRQNPTHQKSSECTRSLVRFNSAVNTTKYAEWEKGLKELDKVPVLLDQILMELKETVGNVSKR